jgi:hypothetical protein
MNLVAETMKDLCMMVRMCVASSDLEFDVSGRLRSTQPGWVCDDKIDECNEHSIKHISLVGLVFYVLSIRWRMFINP